MNWKTQLKTSLNQTYLRKAFPALVDHDAYPLQITPHYLQLLSSDDSNSLLKIVVPSEDEKQICGSRDVMNEHLDYRQKGLQHRYPDTVLLMLSDACAGHCRFCFRKRIFSPCDSEDERMEDLRESIAYIKTHKEITNVLLSGGDPLVCSNKKIIYTLEELISIEHLKYVRIGSKVLAYLPQRIIEEPEFVNTLGHLNAKKPILIVTHFEHFMEFSQETTIASKMLKDAGLKLLNQAALLKGVNDSTESLEKLNATLMANSIQPYYIFQNMPVEGSLHFQVPLCKSLSLISELSSTCSGPEKMFKFIIPHHLGKIEGLGFDKDFFYFRFHRSRTQKLNGKIFKTPFDESCAWIKEEEIIFL